MCAVPELAAGERYVVCAAGSSHTVLVTSEGRALAFRAQDFGQCAVPELAAGERYGDPKRARAWVMLALVSRRSEDPRLQAAVAAMLPGGFEQAVWRFV